MTDNPTEFLRNLFDAAVAAADPAVCLPPHLPERPAGRTIVVGAGKAAASMARAVEAHWSGPLSGLAITRYGHALPTRSIEILESGHPLPDSAGKDAAARILDTVCGLTADDLVLALISGGGSALMTLPAPGLTLADKRAVTGALLRCGAPIGEINCVRKHLSAIKGGRLALAAAPARLVTLIISDVPGDDPATVASGPTVPDATTREEALAILERWKIPLPPAVLRHLSDPAAETPKPGDPRLARVETRVIATAGDALEAAARSAEAAGVRPIVLGDAIEGEARLVAAEHAALALEVLGGDALDEACPPEAKGITHKGFDIPRPAGERSERVSAPGEGVFPLGEHPKSGLAAPSPNPLPAGERAKTGTWPSSAPQPLVLLSGGETTVTVRGSGRGGRNAEYLLALALALDGRAGIHAIACDTDGIDGSEDNAGAVLRPDSLARARALGLDPAAMLADNDAYGFFAALGDLVVTGPTHTNVNDFRAILIEPAPPRPA